MRDPFRGVVLVATICLMLASRAFHLLKRPEWTEAQALVAQWPIWLGCTLVMLWLAVTMKKT